MCPAAEEAFLACRGKGESTVGGAGLMLLGSDPLPLFVHVDSEWILSCII